MIRRALHSSALRAPGTHWGRRTAPGSPPRHPRSRPRSRCCRCGRPCRTRGPTGACRCTLQAYEADVGGGWYSVKVRPRQDSGGPGCEPAGTVSRRQQPLVRTRMVRCCHTATHSTAPNHAAQGREQDISCVRQCEAASHRSTHWPTVAVSAHPYRPGTMHSTVSFDG